MQEWIIDWWDVTCLLGVMGLSTCLILRLAQVLSGISEIEEVHASPDGPSSSGGNKNSLGAGQPQTSEECRQRVRASRSPVRPQTVQKKTPARRSLSLPSGGLSYGDVKILYRDGHFVTVDASSERADADTAGQGYDGTGRGTSDTRGGDSQRGNPLSSMKDGTEDFCDSEGIMHAEILSLLESGIADPQGGLSETSQGLDVNSNSWVPVAGRSSMTARGQGGAGAPFFLSLPRRTEKGRRPVSMDEARLWKHHSKSQQSLVSHAELARRRKEEEEEEDRVDADKVGASKQGSSLKRNNSFTEAMGSTLMLNDVDDRKDSIKLAEDGNDTFFEDPKYAPEESQSEKSRSRGPGLIQRMLQKRKGSGNDKALSLSTSSKSVSSLSLPTASSSPQPPNSPSKRDGRESSLTRKMSFRGIFKRKNSADLSTKKPPQAFGEPGTPPIATFLLNDDIGAVPSSPASSSRRMTPLSHCNSQSSLYRGVSHDEPDRPSGGGERQARSCSSRTRGHGGRRSRDSSTDDFDPGSPDRHSSEDTLTPRSMSPSVGELSFEGEQTLLASPASSLDRPAPPVYQQLDSSPRSGRHRTFTPRNTRDTGHSGSDTSMDRGEIISSNSNDSGIQHDVNVDSSAESIQGGVKLRRSKSPSPTTERPKSDITVKWADLLEQVMDAGDVRYRREASRLRRRPRPKSDIAGFHHTDSRRTLLMNANSMGNISSTSSAAATSGSLPGAMNIAGASSSSSVNISSTSSCSSSSNITKVRSTSTSDVVMMRMQSGESLLSLVELRRPGRDGARDRLSAKLAKIRRLSTPQPIALHAEKPKEKPCKTSHPASTTTALVTHAHSMPDNLDKLTRKKNYFSLIGSDAQSVTSQQSAGDESSDESEYSVDYHPDKSLSTRSSHVMLTTLDQMLEEEKLTYAEALWDHVTMDPEELGFRAGDLIRVTDAADKHWWFGVLDDNEGWFPATFVRLRVNQEVMEEELAYLLAEQEEVEVDSVTAQHAGGVMSTPSCLDKHQARANVVNEIISAERDYVKHLRDVVEGYVKQARKRPEMFPIEKVTIIFSNIEEIYSFATDLLTQLELSVHQDQPYYSQLGHCFLDKVKGFEMYSDYCNNHPAACEELRELYRNKRYRHFFEACRLLQEMIEIPLEGFLLTPVQKICKYHLQLAELLKFTPPGHPDYVQVQGALEAMKKIATLINERKRKMESIEKLATWQLLVDDWEGPDILEKSSELIYSGELSKINHAGWSQERYFFLFDHQLIYCKKDLLKKSSFCFKGRINMDSCQVVSIPDGRDMQYSVSVRNAWKLHDTHKDKWYLLVAKTVVAKQRWLKAFQDERRRVKDDAENNFNIPSHVKQAVIANFKQKANLNKPKGKAKFARANSSQALGSFSRVDAYATLPRSDRHKVKSEASLDKGRKVKVGWFFLGKGKTWKD